MTTSHKVLWAVVITYFIGVALGVYAIIKDPTNVGMVLGYIGGVAAVGIGFYSWKAKAENTIKIRNSLNEQEIKMRNAIGDYAYEETKQTVDEILAEIEEEQIL